MQKSLKVSVVIPTYNNGQHIQRSIDSVLAQTVMPFEIIIVDDGSTDNTSEIIKSYGEKVRYIYQDNAGASAARNTGIQAATSDWIAFLDADDEWLPDKTKLQTELLARNPDLVWTTGNYIECLCEEKRSGVHTSPTQCVRHLNGKDFYESYFRAIQLCEWGHTDCMVIRKDIFEGLGMFRVGQLKANDIDMWLRIAYQYPAIGFSSEPLAIYHLSVPDSIVKTYRKNAVHADFIQRHLNLARQQGVSEQFKPAAAFMMRRWIRGMLFDGRKSEIRELLRRFPGSFSFFYRVLIFGLTVFSDFTAWWLRVISKIVRAFNLRRRVTRRPAKR